MCESIYRCLFLRPIGYDKSVQQVVVITIGMPHCRSMPIIAVNNRYVKVSIDTYCLTNRYVKLSIEIYRPVGVKACTIGYHVLSTPVGRSTSWCIAYRLIEYRYAL